LFCHIPLLADGVDQITNGFLAIHVSASSLVRATLSRLAILRRQHT
jgi:hypothetical protein